MSNPSNRIRAILRALDYTPKTLAADLDVSPKVPKRILTDGKGLYFGEYMEICHAIGMNPDTLMMSRKPDGTRKGGDAA